MRDLATNIGILVLMMIGMCVVTYIMLDKYKIQPEIRQNNKFTSEYKNSLDLERAFNGRHYEYLGIDTLGQLEFENGQPRQQELINRAIIKKLMEVENEKI